MAKSLISQASLDQADYLANKGLTRYVPMPVQLDGRGDLEDILGRMALLDVVVRVADAQEAEALGDGGTVVAPKRRAQRAMRSECWPFPDMR